MSPDVLARDLRAHRANLSELGPDGVVDKPSVGTVQHEPRALAKPLLRQFDRLVVYQHRHVMLAAGSDHGPQRRLVVGMARFIGNPV